jgi:hypothetical protein
MFMNNSSSSSTTRPYVLQTFITSSSAGSAGRDGDGDMTGTMRAGDLEALRQYKRKKANVRGNSFICCIFCSAYFLLFIRTVHDTSYPHSL